MSVKESRMCNLVGLCRMERALVMIREQLKLISTHPLKGKDFKRDNMKIFILP